ncbi:hypothetical protein HUS23_11285 [Ectothiorhodospiraceae bacterium 2226]|nr:hypothetical protein HUS23_11285 [Ectothiorhodospiraceae bacterium 2226]
MQNVVAQAPYDASQIYPAGCADPIPSGANVDLRIVSGAPRVRYGGVNYVWGSGTGQRCFLTNGSYMARLNADAGTQPSNYLPAPYSGNYLNWYFDSTNTTPFWTAGQTIKPSVASRMTVAREAAQALVGSLRDVRLGLARYSDVVDFTDARYLPAHIMAGVDHIDLNRTTVSNAIAALSANGLTPLAESLHSVGRYFVQGHNQPLTLHPDASSGYPYAPSTHDAYSIFNVPPTYAAGVRQASPIEHWCQQNYAVIMTDGRPQADRALSTHPIAAYRDYDGDCLGGGCLSFDRKPERDYESRGSDYLDDVAAALYDIDLRPDLVDAEGRPVKNNLATYVIGFAEEDVLHDPLLQETAAQGGGRFLVADDEDGLIRAFQTASDTIFAQVSSASSVAANSTRLDTDTVVYQARFNSADWSGQLYAFALRADGSVDPTPRWEAGALIPPPAARRIITYEPNSGQTALFAWPALNAAQQAALHRDGAGEPDGRGEQRLAWLRGAEVAGMRPRSTSLGDLVNSDPLFVGSQDYGFTALPYAEAASYAAFRASVRERPPMIYIGSNAGMLHGFDAETGAERFAYVPNAVYAALSQLTAPDYRHRYYVDGSPRASDAYIDTGDGQGARWRTVLLGSTGAGGRAVFALDVTDPDAPRVLWEFTELQDAGLGYTIGQPTVVRTAAGWMAVFGNGYNSADHRARLFVVDLATGALVARLDTGLGDSAHPNGLASPAPYAPGHNRVTSAIYAGDLLGRLWKFDLSGNVNTWGVAYRQGNVPQPLFVARDAAGNEQPITSRPALGTGPDGAAGTMVYFGTGRYFADGDNHVPDAPAVQSFYGILDNGSVLGAGRSALVEQSILAEVAAHGDDWRVTTEEPVRWADQRGWFIDLVSPAAGPQGERVVSAPLLRHGRVIFVTLVPDRDPCAFGGGGWLMEMSALTGARLAYTPFDVDGDGAFSADDFLRVIIDGEPVDVPVSGRRSREGIIKSPGIVSAGETEYKYTSGSSGNIEVTVERGSDLGGRQSWRELR